MNDLLERVEGMKDKGDPKKLVKIMKDLMELQNRSDEEISDKPTTTKPDKDNVWLIHILTRFTML